MEISRTKRKLILALSKLGRFEAWKRLFLKLMVRYAAPERPRRFPIRIQIEATSKCNLCCPCCSHSREKGAGRHLAQEDLRRILDRLPRSPRRVVLSGIGEPLVNPEFFSLVDILAERGIQCEFYTNGTLLTPRVRQEILSRPNIDAISISCDGAEKATFERLRLGADFERWKQSARAFLAEAKRQRAGTLTIGMNLVVSNQNVGEMEDIIRLAAELGFDSVGIMHPIPVDRTPREPAGTGKKPGAKAALFLPSSEDAARGAATLHAIVGVRLHSIQRGRRSLLRRVRLREGRGHGQYLRAGV
jgi:MoaA/NifB/PqqE/SkfB family radical SAM enzyme